MVHWLELQDLSVFQSLKIGKLFTQCLFVCVRARARVRVCVL